MDREKVKKELLELNAEAYELWVHDQNNEFLAQIGNVTDDALALLKEQEAESGEWITIWREDDPDTSSHARCSVCNRISERPLGGYCKWCGAKMSQEWGVDG